VALFHSRELDVDVLASGIALLAGEHQVQIGSVVFVLQVVQPNVESVRVQRHERKYLQLI
jgi:hypothetical protein